MSFIEKKSKKLLLYGNTKPSSMSVLVTLPKLRAKMCHLFCRHLLRVVQGVEMRWVLQQRYRCSKEGWGRGKWRAGSRTLGVQGRDDVCVCRNMTAKKWEKKKEMHRSCITDGGLTQLLTVSHLLLSHAVKPHWDCELYVHSVLKLYLKLLLMNVWNENENSMQILFSFHVTLALCRLSFHVSFQRCFLPITQKASCNMCD